MFMALPRNAMAFLHQHHQPQFIAFRLRIRGYSDWYGEWRGRDGGGTDGDGNRGCDE